LPCSCRYWGNSVDPSRRRRASWSPAESARVDIASVKASGAELETALTAAERLLLQGQEDKRHAQNVRFAAVSLFLLTVASLAGIIIAVVESARTGGLIALVVLCGAALPVLFYMLRLLRESGGRESSVHVDVAIEIASMVREVFLEVAAREQWSRMRIESTRLRLSVFPLRSRADTVRPVRNMPLVEDEGSG
jgi:hypothetical protein